MNSHKVSDTVYHRDTSREINTIVERVIESIYTLETGGCVACE
jgi:hypothetical protein